MDVHSLAQRIAVVALTVDCYVWIFVWTLFCSIGLLIRGPMNVTLLLITIVINYILISDSISPSVLFFSIVFTPLGLLHFHLILESACQILPRKI